MPKLAIFFPGIGYHTDKPLLYYSRRLATQAGYETINVQYSGFPSDVKGNPEKMKQAFVSALAQTEACLRDIDYASYEQLLFVSKSVGTAVAAAYAANRKVSPAQIFYTPVEASFSFMQPDGIVFTGTKDPWVETDIVRTNCDRLRLPLTIIPDANHSLETGDALRDIKILQDIMAETKAYIDRIGKEQL